MAAKPRAKRIGDLQQVENTARRFGSAPAYLFARLQLPSGLEAPYLFTESELVRAEERARRNPEDLLQAGVVRDFLD